MALRSSKSVSSDHDPPLPRVRRRKSTRRWLGMRIRLRASGIVDSFKPRLTEERGVPIMMLRITVGNYQGHQTTVRQHENTRTSEKSNNLLTLNQDDEEEGLYLLFPLVTRRAHTYKSHHSAETYKLLINHGSGTTNRRQTSEQGGNRDGCVSRDWSSNCPGVRPGGSFGRLRGHQGVPWGEERGSHAPSDQKFRRQKYLCQGGRGGFGEHEAARRDGGQRILPN